MLDLETFLTTLYVTIDDFCQTQRPSHGRRGPAPALSPSEVMTLALLEQWSCFATERDFYRWAKRHLHALFPTLPDRSQYNRLVRQQQEALTAWALQWVPLLAREGQVYEALDGTAVPVRNYRRRGRSWLVGQADLGLSKRLGWYFGFKVLISVTPEGVITGFGFGSASTSEQRLAETFFSARHQPTPALSSVGSGSARAYAGDKGFWGDRPHARWKAWFGIDLVTVPYEGAKRPWPKRWRRWLASLRQIVETVFGKLEGVFKLDRERPHTLAGFATRLAAKVALHNFCIWLNQQLGRPNLAFADLFGW